MKPPRIPERIVQRQVVHLLRSLGGLVWVLGTARPRTDGHQGTCQTSGLPDCIAVIRGRMVMIECKAIDGRLSDAQRVFQQACRDCDVSHLVGGVDEVLGWLQQQGLVKPESVPWYRQDGAGAKSPRLATQRRPGAAQGVGPQCHYAGSPSAARAASKRGVD